MKKMILVVLILFAGIFFAQPLLAVDKDKSKVVVLDETSFVVIKERTADDFVVMLYNTRDGKVELLDAIVLDALFTSTPPKVKIHRVKTKYENP